MMVRKIHAATNHSCPLLTQLHIKASISMLFIAMPATHCDIHVLCVCSSSLRQVEQVGSYLAAPLSTGAFETST